jgi:prepilin-type N-terminal cleavage/methylation domain-containing protein
VSAARRDDGFTLVELLVCITILGIVMVALCAAVSIGLRSTVNANVMFDESNTAQFTSLHYASDVQGAESVAVNDSTSSCGGAAKLKLTSTNADRVVAYAVTGSSSPYTFVRRVCSPSSATPLETTLASNLTSTSAVAASCNTGCKQVTLSVDQPGATGIADLDFTLVASPRISP